jgi:hypothetical protein
MVLLEPVGNRFHQVVKKNVMDGLQNTLIMLIILINVDQFISVDQFYQHHQCSIFCYLIHWVPKVIPLFQDSHFFLLFGFKMISQLQ